MTTRIPVSKGKYYALVDDEDVELVSGFSWCASTTRRKNSTIYASTRSKTNRVWHRMHRLIMGVTSDSFVVDHINGDSLDNRRENLRVCKCGENSRNYRRSSGTLGVRGVQKTAQGKFRARIRLNNIGYDIGTFDTIHDASVAYAFASHVFHGEFGSLPGHEAFLKDADRRLPEGDVSMLENIQTV